MTKSRPCNLLLFTHPGESGELLKAFEWKKLSPFHYLHPSGQWHIIFHGIGQYECLLRLLHAPLDGLRCIYSLGMAAGLKKTQCFQISTAFIQSDIDFRPLVREAGLIPFSRQKKAWLELGHSSRRQSVIHLLKRYQNTFLEGKMASASYFLKSQEEVEALIKLGADAFDCESACLAKLSRDVFDSDFISLKYLSDPGNEKAEEEYKKNFDFGSTQLGKIATQLIREFPV